MFTCTLLWCPSQPLFHILGWLFYYFWIMKMPTSFLITSKMFELGSCASQDSDMLLVLCVIAEVSCPMPSGNSDSLQVMPGSSRSNLNISTSLTFILHSRDTADRKKERKTTSMKESQQFSTWTQTQREQMPTTERESVRKDAECREQVARKTDAESQH